MLAEKGSFFAENMTEALTELPKGVTEGDTLPKTSIIYTQPGVPLIDIFEINPMRSELDGRDLAWSQFRSKRKGMIIVKVRIDDIEKAIEACSRSSLTGRIKLDEIIPEPGYTNGNGKAK